MTHSELVSHFSLFESFLSQNYPDDNANDVSKTREGMLLRLHFPHIFLKEHIPFLLWVKAFTSKRN